MVKLFKTSMQILKKMSIFLRNKEWYIRSPQQKQASSYRTNDGEHVRPTWGSHSSNEYHIHQSDVAGVTQVVPVPVVQPLT